MSLVVMYIFTLIAGPFLFLDVSSLWIREKEAMAGRDKEFGFVCSEVGTKKSNVQSTTSLKV